MKKSILKLGKALNKKTQKTINGGGSFTYPMGSCFEPGTNPPVLITRVPCNETCPDGGAPICFIFDDGVFN